MAHIQTVLGAVDPSQVGFTLPVEHLYTSTWERGRHKGNPTLWGGESSLLPDDDVLAGEIAAFQAQGGSCIVDATPPGIGRQPEALASLARRTGLHVVMGCGWYRGTLTPASDRLERQSVAQIAEILVAEARDGVGGSGIRPGCIGETGSDRSFISSLEERILRASARASLATGLPIVTHAWHSAVGLDQLDLLEEEGVDPSRVAIGHVESHPVLDYWLAVCERGAFVLVADVGRMLGRFEERIAGLIRALVERGYERQVLLSHDIGQNDELAYYGGRGFSYLAASFIPKLREIEIPADVITQMTADNPRRLLTIAS